jgi:cytochrome P450
MGYDLNSLENGAGELAEALNAYFNHMSTQLIPTFSQIFKETFVPNWDREVQKARQVVMKFIDELVSQTRREVEEEQQGKIDARSSLLKELIRTVEEDDAFTDDELRGEVLTIMGAGLDTTSILLSWCIVMLCKNPQYHAILRREVIETVGETGLPSMDQLPKLTQINNFLQETLRTHSPAPLNGGDALEPFNVDGVDFPVGTRVFLLTNQIIRNSLPDPDAFRPERYEQASDNRTFSPPAPSMLSHWLTQSISAYFS